MDLKSPLLDEDYDNPLGFKLSLYERYEATFDWFEIDVNMLTISTHLRQDSEGSSASFLKSVDEKAKVYEACKGSWYRSLDWTVTADDEFRFDFSSAKVRIGSPDFPILRLSQIPYVLFPQHIKSSMFKRFRAVAREARAHRRMLRELEAKKEREREELRKKQQMEIQQKQKELLQLAIKRAQNASQTKKATPVVSTPPQPPKPANVWSSAGVPAMQPLPSSSQSAWSSAAARPMMPPPVPVTWPVLVPAVPVADPWAVWSSKPAAEPQPKRPKPDQP